MYFNKIKMKNCNYRINFQYIDSLTLVMEYNHQTNRKPINFLILFYSSYQWLLMASADRILRLASTAIIGYAWIIASVMNLIISLLIRGIL